MATVPATIIIKSDSVNLPMKALLVVVKQLFQYGVKSITVKNDMVIVALSYSPKGITLQKKFGNLPITFLRTKLNVDEIEIFEKVIMKYKFNYEGDASELEESNSKLKSKNLQACTLITISDNEDDGEDGNQKRKRGNEGDDDDEQTHTQRKKRNLIEGDDEFEIFSQEFI